MLNWGMYVFTVSDMCVDCLGYAGAWMEWMDVIEYNFLPFILCKHNNM